LTTYKTKSIINSNEDQEDLEDDGSEDEGIEDYKIGGYHPIHIGEVLLERYVII
jgi:serine/threonine-protein kinase SRPK3